MPTKSEARALRRRFLGHLLRGFGMIAPILIGLVSLMAALGITVAMLEHWSVFEGVYFAFVSALTIGYGDFAPETGLGRVLAILIGVLGIVLGGMIAAVGVQALQASQHPDPQAGDRE